VLKQRTIRTPVSVVGVGLHSGRKVKLSLLPSQANTGIVFQRVDLDPVVSIKADPRYVTDTRLCSCLTKDAIKIGTVEHLMSALAGLGIDNLIVQVDGPEIPIVDGSAAPFVFLIRSAGISYLPEPKSLIRIKKPIKVEKDDKWAMLKPYDGFRVSFTIDFDHPVFKPNSQQVRVDFSTQSFVDEVSRARTFGFVKEIESLRAAQLALGGSIDNAIVLDDYRVLNPDGLRYADEFVRHKVLDAIGDIYLLGHGIIGELVCHKSGHELNNLLVRKLLDQSHAWEWVTYSSANEAPVSYAQPAF
jgi:UDP-3-O-[3-hydroxymyristoyl] N-acetylglucosamine deacetylase